MSTAGFTTELHQAKSKTHASNTGPPAPFCMVDSTPWHQDLILLFTLSNDEREGVMRLTEVVGAVTLSQATDRCHQHKAQGRTVQHACAEDG